MNKLLFLVLIMFAVKSNGQRTLDILSAVKMAQEKSVGAKIVRTTFNNKYWGYKLFKSN